MNKHFLLRRISVIHSIKCNRAESFDVAVQSFDKLNELKVKVINAANELEEDLTNEINNWAGSNPIATDREINNLM